MKYYTITLCPSEVAIGPIDAEQLDEIREHFRRRGAIFTVTRVETSITIEPVLTEVLAGYMVTLRGPDGEPIRSQMCVDLDAARVLACEWGDS